MLATKQCRRPRKGGTVSETSSPAIEITFSEIDRQECLDLLKTQSVGRLAVADHGYYPPHIVPVNFELHGEQVVFRTDDGHKFQLSILAEHSVSFEVDSVDPWGRMAWSVVVQGRAELLTQAEVDALPYAKWLQPLAPGDRRHWVRIVPYAITGRRLRPAPRKPDSP